MGRSMYKLDDASTQRLSMQGSATQLSMHTQLSSYYDQTIISYFGRLLLMTTSRT